MLSLNQLPAVNAGLNGLAATLLVVGFFLIRKGYRRAHQVLMTSAFLCSVLFLISYLYYHAQVGSRRFPGTGLVRTFYFSVLSTHTVLAAAVPVLATWTLALALRGQLARHRRFARWTFPIWLYVSATGVLIYFMLYQW